MGGNARVEAIWEQLNSHHSTSKHRATVDSLLVGAGLGSMRDAAAAGGGGHRQADAARKQLQRCSSGGRVIASSSKQAASAGLAAPAAPAACGGQHQPDLSAATLERLTQALQSSACGDVRAALQQIQAMAVRPAEAAADGLPTQKLGKAVLRCFEHRSEACRELAAATATALLRADPDATLALLPYAMPVLEERLHADEAHNPTEPCEEVRLLLLQLLSLILEQAGAAVAAYASEVWSILMAALADSFHEVTMQACAASQQLAGVLGRRLGSTSKELVAVLLPLTTHKSHRVRVAAIGAVRDVVHQGAHEMVLEMVAWRDPNVVPIKAFYGDDTKVNFCGKLATDPHLQVRLAFLDMVGSWMLTLDERRDHEARLLPYVLSGLCDNAPAVVAAALQLLEQLGQQHEADQQQQLEDVLRFGEQVEGRGEALLLAALQAGTVSYAAAVAAAAGHSGGGAADIAAGAALTAAAATPTLLLPGPFSQRPRLGSRLLVRANFSTVLPALCHELSAWQAGPRSMAARLLLVNLLLVESAAERHLHVVLPALCSAIGDADAGSAVAHCALVLGCFCGLQRLLEHLAPCLQEWAAEPQRQARALRVLASVLRGARACGQVEAYASDQLAQLLASPVLADSCDTALRQAVAEVLVAEA